MRTDPKAPSADVIVDDPRASLPARTQTLIGLTGSGWVFYAVRSTITRDREFAMATGLAAVLTFTVYAVHRVRPRWTRPLAHCNCAIATIFILVICSLTGQVHSPSLPYLVCVPLCMGYLHGMRTAILWAAICSVAALLNHGLFLAAPLAPVYDTNQNDITLAVVVLIFLTVGLVTGAERIHAAHAAALKRREATIEELNRGLERKSEEAEQARDRAIAASRAKGDFVATLSHEIRTPLNGVLGMSGLLLGADLPPQQAELVRTIRTSGDALLTLLNDMLDFSKIEAGRLDLEHAPFDLRDCVEDTFDLLGVSAAGKRLRLACLVDTGAVTRVKGDAGRVRQVLVNLVGNAVKFTDEGEIVVEIHSRQIPVSIRGLPPPGPRDEQASSGAAGSAPRCEISLVVRDTGRGIAKERIGSLFEPFTQADSSTTRKFGGTGLGLAICRRLAEAMGGRAWVESELGQGATFHVTLRLEAEDDAPSSEVPEAPGKRVLVASPHASTRASIAAQIEAFGAEAVPCPTTADLRRALAAAPADAVVAEASLSTRDSGTGEPPEIRLLLPWEVLHDEPFVVRAPVRRADLRRALSRLWGVSRPSMSTPLPVVPFEPSDAPSVLVAEDNPVNQRVVCLMLERLGCSADVVGNGLEALAAVRARPYDLVMMDVRMPEMDGIAATQALRAELSEGRRPLIVAMTANVAVEDRAACEAAGMDDFIAKPILAADLARIVDRARARSKPVSA
ncbi:MAG: ATP-binding protein [Polyangiaceae bacterium]